MNDSHDIDMPYHPGCKHRYIEHLDHNALIKRLNEIADEIYKLTQLCVGLQEQLVNHDGSSDAHRSIRESIAAVGTRISTIKVAVDDSLNALGNKVDANYNTLSAADTALANRIGNIDSEIEDIQRDLDNISLNLEDGITSTVSGNTPIIKSVASPGDITLAELPSTHGKFKYKAENTKSIITYTANNNSTGVPNYTAILLDESGNTSFPGTVSAPTFDGNATTATLATKASKLNTSINMMIKDASGENAGPAVTTNLSSDVTLRLPATLKGTDITGTASKATADATGANIADTYVHKVNINEEINGIKTFNNTVKSNVVVPKTSAGSSLGNNNTPYEHIYSTNINGVTATITTITGNLTGNAATATKLTTARAINGTDFDGTTAITTSTWGTARDISIADSSATNTGAATSVNGSGNATLKLPSTIKATITGNASTATKLNTPRKINNTSFDGSADITTARWGAARNITIADASATNTGAATSVNGSGNVTLKLPSVIAATSFNGIASSARKLNSTVRVNGTTFDGSADITTNVWGYSRDFTISNSDGTGTSAVASVDGSSNVALKLPAAIKASLNGNADTATKLKTARTINGTSFDGSANITTDKWGTARNITISDNEGVYTGNTASVNGSANVTLKLPASIKATLVGNADTATKLKTARTINGTSFDGSANITTDKWGTARNITITDAAASHSGSAVSVNGSGNVTLKLPSSIKATLVGNADTATEFSSSTTVTLTGDATGTSAGSKKGWSVPVTLANSGVTAGKYGPSANVTGNDGVTIKVPEITVDAKGRVTAITDRVYTSVNDTNNIDLSLYPYKLSSIHSTYGNGRWPYIDLADANNHDFNTVVTPGKYHVRFDATTLNTPFEVTGTAVRDGILDVEGTSSATSVLSYQRCYQTFTSSLSSVRTFKRRGYYTAADGWVWSDWSEFAKTSDIPTKTSELTNDSGFLTSHQSLANYSTLANTVKSLSISGKTITVTPGSGSAYTLTTQDTVYTHPTTAGNKHIPSGGAANQYLKYSASGTAAWATIKTSELTNDSGYLTSHQDLSNYVTLNGAQTISATKTISADLKFSTTATRGTTPSGTIGKRIANYVDSAGNNIGLIGMYYNTDKSSETKIFAYKTTEATGNNIGCLGIGCDATGSIYTIAPTPATDDSSTKIATTKWVRNQGYITADQDTKVKQNKISNTNTNIYNLLTTKASTSDTTIGETCFAAGVEVWPSWAQLRITDAYHTDNLKGTAATLDNARYTGGISFYTNDGGDEGAVNTYIDTDGGRTIWLFAANYITDNNISPNGTRTTSGLRLRVGADGGRGVFVQGRWECGLQPYESNTYSLGTNAYKWKRLYVNQIIADNINIDALPTILPTYQYTTSITPSFDASTQTLTLTYTAITVDQYGRVSGYETKRASTRIDISTSEPAITPIQVTTKTLYYGIKGYGGNSPYSKGAVVAGSALFEQYNSRTHALSGAQDGSWFASGNASEKGSYATGNGGHYSGPEIVTVYQQTFKQLIL